MNATSQPPSVHAIVDGWLDGFREAISAVRRLDAADGDYSAELGDNYAISDALSRVRRALLAAETAAGDIRGRYLEFSFLWTSDLNAALEVSTSFVVHQRLVCAHFICRSDGMSMQCTAFYVRTQPTCG